MEEVEEINMLWIEDKRKLLCGSQATHAPKKPANLEEQDIRTCNCCCRSLALLLHLGTNSPALGQPLWNHRHVKENTVTCKGENNLVVAAADMREGIDVTQPYTIAPYLVQEGGGAQAGCGNQPLPNGVYSFLKRKREHVEDDVLLGTAAPLSLEAARDFFDLVNPPSEHFGKKYKLGTMVTQQMQSHLAVILVSWALAAIHVRLKEESYQGLWHTIASNVQARHHDFRVETIQSPGFVDVRNLLQQHTQVRVCGLDGMHRMFYLPYVCSKMLPCSHNPHESETTDLINDKPRCASVWANPTPVKFFYILEMANGAFGPMDRHFCYLAKFRSMADQNVVLGANPRTLAEAICHALDSVTLYADARTFSDDTLLTGQDGTPVYGHQRCQEKIIAVSTAYAKALLLDGNSPTNTLVAPKKMGTGFDDRFKQDLNIRQTFVNYPPQNTRDGVLHALCRFLVLFVQDQQACKLVRDMVNRCGRPRLSIQGTSGQEHAISLWDWNDRRPNSIVWQQVTILFLLPLKQLVDMTPQPNSTNKRGKRMLTSKKCRRFEFLVAGHIAKDILKFYNDFGLSALSNEVLSRLDITLPTFQTPLDPSQLQPTSHVVFLVIAELVKLQKIEVKIKEQCAPQAAYKPDAIRYGADCSRVHFAPEYAVRESLTSLHTLAGDAPMCMYDLACVLLFGTKNTSLIREDSPVGIGVSEEICHVLRDQKGWPPAMLGGSKGTPSSPRLTVPGTAFFFQDGRDETPYMHLLQLAPPGPPIKRQETSADEISHRLSVPGTAFYFQLGRDETPYMHLLQLAPPGPPIKRQKTSAAEISHHLSVPGTAFYFQLGRDETPYMHLLQLAPPGPPIKRRKTSAAEISHHLSVPGTAFYFQLGRDETPYMHLLQLAPPGPPIKRQETSADEISHRLSVPGTAFYFQHGRDETPYMHLLQLAPPGPPIKRQETSAAEISHRLSVPGTAFYFQLGRDETPYMHLLQLAPPGPPIKRRRSDDKPDSEQSTAGMLEWISREPTRETIYNETLRYVVGGTEGSQQSPQANGHPPDAVVVSSCYQYLQSMEKLRKKQRLI